ncbi:DUF3239 domain-containing protein [Pseudocitrobacter corydidari]|uniref:Uncharacterized protein n=1 Tax=Pseudocitrobacter corydidari TaxID=2891570 RepID=A0ABY3S9I8_9ENTR|nr:DUF3239 domain-containing protein [Pseudocitrobacter corydidari]UGS42784.1 hypothetical protein G163CM_35440 [Pseudocitrobacter corydidari]
MEKNATSVGSGPYINDSYAIRHLHFPINIKHSIRYNQEWHSDIIVIILLVTTSILSTVLSYYFFDIKEGWRAITGGIFAIISLALFIFLLLAIHKTGKPHTFFKRGVLNPGIICHIGDGYVGILVLAELTINATSWGLVSLQAKRLPGHNLTLGERIPVTCCFIENDSGHAFAIAYALPIAWGTNDASVIQYGIDSIPQQEWDILEQLKKRYKDLDRDHFPLASTLPERLQYLTSDEIKKLGLDKIFES